MVVNKNRIILIIVAALFVLSAIYTQYFRVNVKLEKFKNNPLVEADVFYIPDTTTLEIFSLGYPWFMSDLVMVKALSYFVTHLFTDRIFTWIDVYLDRVTKLDPLNLAIYEWAMKIVEYKQFISNDVLLESNSWAQKGIKYYPDAWELYFQIGFNYFFEWDFINAEDKKMRQRQALDYFMIAASLPNSQLDPNFVTELYLRNNEKQMALFFALQKYFEASENEKELLLRRIYFFVSKEAGEFLKQRDLAWKENFPYISSELFLLVGKKLDYSIPPDFANYGKFNKLMENFHD